MNPNTYKNSIPEIANRIKYCVTQEAVVEFFKAELLLAYDHGYQDGYLNGHIDGQIDEVREMKRILDKPIPDIDRPEISGESRLNPIFQNILAAVRMGRV